MQAVVHAPGYAWDGAELLEACGLAVWEFDHLIAEQVRYFAPQEYAPRASPVVDLTDGWDNWIARKKTSRRIKRSREQERKLEREHGPLRFVLDSRDPRHLDLLMQWKSAQYRRTGRFDRFARRWFADGMRQLFETRTETFSGELSVTFVRDRPVSLCLSLRADGILGGWFPAYDVDFARYGPGTIHQRHLLMHAAANGIRLFDCGAGEERYKQTFRDLDIGLARGVLRRSAVIAVAHRMQRAPRRLATEFVLSRPPLRRAARKALLLIANLRSLLHPGSGAFTPMQWRAARASCVLRQAQVEGEILVALGKVLILSKDARRRSQSRGRGGDSANRLSSPASASPSGPELCRSRRRP